MRRFEFAEGGSKKFWEVSQDGSSFTVRFGRLGTDGQTKTTPCASADEAAKEVAKLIKEKTKKGYQEIAAAGAPADAAPVAKALRRPPVYPTSTHQKHFMNYAVAEFDPEEGLKDLERKVYALRTDYDGGEEALAETLTALLDDPKVGQLKGLVLGQWFGELCEEGPNAVMARLIEAKGKLGSLKGIFLGDITGEENEISWIKQSDLAPLLHAFPQVEEVVVRGGEGLRFRNLKHGNLRTLVVQAGGLDANCIRDLAGADLPNLERVALWMGCDNYGGNYRPEDLAPILTGKAWPRLEYLGLMNSDQADHIAVALDGAAILGRIRALDLSMGTLTDVGGQALLANPALRSLAFINLRHHYMTPKVTAELRRMGVEIDVSDAEKPEDYGDGEVFMMTEVSE